MLSRSLLTTTLALGLIAPAAAQTLMSCPVTSNRGSGENVEIIYDETACRPVTNREVLGTVTSGNSTTTIYGAAEQPTRGGGQLYIMRFVDQSQGPVIRYGPPLDGNPGTVGR